jgi:hypothetical protein
LDEEEKKNSGIILSSPPEKPKCYASMDEIVSVVEEVRQELYDSKKIIIADKLVDKLCYSKI